VKRLPRILWGTPSGLRCIFSLAGGVALGVLIPASPMWVIWLILLMCLRTHWPCAAAGWLCGVLVYHASHTVCEQFGMSVLNANPALWRRVLSAPVLCYTRLYVGVEMGHAVLALIAGLGVLAILLPVLVLVRARRARVHHQSA
jgi:hypothetical protein